MVKSSGRLKLSLGQAWVVDNSAKVSVMNCRCWVMRMVRSCSADEVKLTICMCRVTKSILTGQMIEACEGAFVE